MCDSEAHNSQFVEGSDALLSPPALEGFASSGYHLSGSTSSGYEVPGGSLFSDISESVLADPQIQQLLEDPSSLEDLFHDADQLSWLVNPLTHHINAKLAGGRADGLPQSPKSPIKPARAQERMQPGGNRVSTSDDATCVGGIGGSEAAGNARAEGLTHQEPSKNPHAAAGVAGGEDAHEGKTQLATLASPRTIAAEGVRQTDASGAGASWRCGRQPGVASERSPHAPVAPPYTASAVGPTPTCSRSCRGYSDGGPGERVERVRRAWLWCCRLIFAVGADGSENERGEREQKRGTRAGARSEGRRKSRIEERDPHR